MIAITLLSVLLLAAPQDSSSTSSNSTSQLELKVSPSPPAANVSSAPSFTPEQQEQIRQKMEQMRLQHEPERQEAIRLNDLAANIRSEADARKFVDAIAEQLTHHQHLMWAALSIRHRVAHAEYEAVSDPSGLISEQRIVDVWNEYVREIDAPEDTLITVPEFHAFRRTQLWMTANFQWKRDMMQSVWTMPNIYAVDGDGQLADGCRALEALKLIHEMHERFGNVRAARERLAKGLPFPDVPKKASPDPSPTAARLVASTDQRAVFQNPILPAVYRFQQEHGDRAYDQLVRRLFNELMPAE
jgi:hypothetical protein